MDLNSGFYKIDFEFASVLLEKAKEAVLHWYLRRKTKVHELNSEKGKV